MITLIMVLHNEEKYLERALKSSLKFVDSCVFIDQESTDSTLGILRSVRKNKLIIRRSFKGNADPDRNFAYSFGKNWVLALDADEILPQKTGYKLRQLESQNRYDIFWFNFKNLINKVDIRPILGSDPHPRFFRPNSINWPAEAHTFPQLKTPRVAWSNLEIIHDREFNELVKRNRERAKFITPDKVRMQEVFLEKVKQFIGSQIETDPKKARIFKIDGETK